jgi:hypothetical protein
MSATVMKLTGVKPMIAPSSIASLRVVEGLT